MYNLQLEFQTSDLERFFIEKSLELLYKNTIDTYRLRLNSPKSAISELANICSLMVKKELNNHEYAHALCKEVSKLLEAGDDELIFNSISRDYYSNLLAKPHDKYTTIVEASRLVINENISYVNKLSAKIEATIAQGATDPSIDFDKARLIGMLTQYFFIELVNLGYSKQYLHKYCLAILLNRDDSFQTKFENLKNLSAKQPENFQLVFGIKKNGFNFNNLLKINSKLYSITKKERARIKAKTNPNNINDFLNNAVKTDQYLFGINLPALDYYQAVNQAMNLLSLDFDIYHLGHSDGRPLLEDEVVVIGEVTPQKASKVPINYQLDGYYRNNNSVFDEFVGRVNKLEELNVSDESKRKIKSAVRYLRLGTETNQLENKLLNYWIGLEYIFTLHIDDSSPINRIKELFPKCHALVYLKRNFVEFHKAIERTNNHGLIPNYNADLKYLENQASYNTLIGSANSMLVKYRSKEYLLFLQQPDKITGYLLSHEENLKRNLIRLYRIRNEIVHNAAIKNSIATNASHLRYYLTFILNSIIDFFNTTPVDINNDSKLTIEDYFIAQDIMLGSLKDKKNLKLTKFLAVKNPLELLT